MGIAHKAKGVWSHVISTSVMHIECRSNGARCKHIAIECVFVIGTSMHFVEHTGMLDSDGNSIWHFVSMKHCWQWEFAELVCSEWICSEFYSKDPNNGKTIDKQLVFPGCVVKQDQRGLIGLNSQTSVSLTTVKWEIWHENISKTMLQSCSTL